MTEDEIIDTCPTCGKETFVVEAEGMTWREDENGEPYEHHYPIGQCKDEKCRRD